MAQQLPPLQRALGRPTAPTYRPIQPPEQAPTPDLQPQYDQLNKMIDQYNKNPSDDLKNQIDGFAKQYNIELSWTTKTTRPTFTQKLSYANKSWNELSKTEKNNLKVLGLEKIYKISILLNKPKLFEQAYEAALKRLELSTQQVILTPGPDSTAQILSMGDAVTPDNRILKKGTPEWDTFLKSQGYTGFVFQLYNPATKQWETAVIDEHNARYLKAYRDAEAVIKALEKIEDPLAVQKAILRGDWGNVLSLLDSKLRVSAHILFSILEDPTYSGAKALWTKFTSKDTTPDEKKAMREQLIQDITEGYYYKYEQTSTPIGTLGYIAQMPGVQYAAFRGAGKLMGPALKTGGLAGGLTSTLSKTGYGLFGLSMGKSMFPTIVKQYYEGGQEKELFAMGVSTAPMIAGYTKGKIGQVKAGEIYTPAPPYKPTFLQRSYTALTEKIRVPSYDWRRVQTGKVEYSPIEYLKMLKKNKMINISYFEKGTPEYNKYYGFIDYDNIGKSTISISRDLPKSKIRSFFTKKPTIETVFKHELGHYIDFMQKGELIFEQPHKISEKIATQFELVKDRTIGVSSKSIMQRTLRGRLEFYYPEQMKKLLSVRSILEQKVRTGYRRYKGYEVKVRGGELVGKESMGLKLETPETKISRIKVNEIYKPGKKEWISYKQYQISKQLEKGITARKTTYEPYFSPEKQTYQYTPEGKIIPGSRQTIPKRRMTIFDTRNVLEEIKKPGRFFVIPKEPITKPLTKAEMIDIMQRSIGEYKVSTGKFKTVPKLEEFVADAGFNKMKFKITPKTLTSAKQFKEFIKSEESGYLGYEPSPKKFKVRSIDVIKQKTPVTSEYGGITQEFIKPETVFERQPKLKLEQVETTKPIFEVYRPSIIDFMPKGLSYKQIQFQTETQEQEYKPLSISAPKFDIMQEQESVSMTKPSFQQEQEQQQRQVQFTRQIQKQEYKQVPIIFEVPKFKITLPEEAPPEEEKPSTSKQGYNVFLKKEATKPSRRWQKINSKPLDRTSALGLGADKAKNTASRSFKITQTSGSATHDGYHYQYWLQHQYQFYKKGDIYIQKTQYSIATAGELQEITFAPRANNAFKQSRRVGIKPSINFKMVGNMYKPQMVKL